MWGYYMEKDKAILALSVRGKRADIFWFTFFHEIAHLINLRKRNLILVMKMKKMKQIKWLEII